MVAFQNYAVARTIITENAAEFYNLVKTMIKLHIWSIICIQKVFYICNKQIYIWCWNTDEIISKTKWVHENSFERSRSKNLQFNWGQGIDYREKHI